MTGFRVVLAVLLVAATAACGGEDRPATPSVTDVALVHDIPDGHPRLPYFDRFAASAESQSDGALAVRINPQDEVLAGRASLDAIRSGRANIAAVNMAHLEALEPAAGFMNLPFGLDDTIMSDPGKRAAVSEILATRLRPHGVELIGIMRGADQLFAFPLDNVRRLEDLRGKRIRVAGDGIYEQVMRGLDAEPVAIPIPEIRAAMSQGTVDGVFTSPGGWSTEVREHAPHAVAVPGLMLITYGLVANSEWLAGLSEPDRAAVVDSGARLTGEWASMRTDDQGVVDTTVAEGATFHVVPPTETARWRHGVADISAEFFARHPVLADTLRRQGLFTA